jgi:peptidoglycan/LPS O-acetylase OafA/YrhL
MLGWVIMREKIPELQALRGVAILMVAGFHFTVRYVTSADNPASAYPYGDFFKPLAPLLNQGRLGVELFFMISGFVISLTLTRSAGFKEFAVKRFVRLWPALILILPLIWLVLQVSPGFAATSSRPIDLLWSLTLIHPSVAAGLTSGAITLSYTTGVLWSLSVELMFYLMAAATYFYTRNFLRSQIIVACALLPFAVLAYQPIWPTNAPMLSALTPLMQLASNYFWFLAGIAVFTLRTRGNNPKLWVLYASCWLATCLIAWAQTLQDLPWFIAVNSVIFAVFASVEFEGKGKLLLQWAPMLALGDFSYEFYLLHEALGISLLQLIGLHTGWTSPWLALLPMALLLPLAWTVKRYWSDAVGGYWRQRLLPSAGTAGELKSNHD